MTPRLSRSNGELMKTELLIVDDEKVEKPIDVKKVQEMLDKVTPKLKSRFNKTKIIIVEGTVYHMIPNVVVAEDL